MKFFMSALLMILFLDHRSQNIAINVTENTFKISGMSEEIFYYGFAEGDQIIFNFQEMDSKELKEIEIIEYPSNSRFMDYKSKKIENKTINVLRTGIYAFRFNNSALLGRVCKIKIDRIAASDKTKYFNTSVKWIDRPDTTWNIYSKDIVVGYDTAIIHKTKKELIKTEASEDLFMEKDGQIVHSQMNSSGNKSSIFFMIPSYPSTEFIKKKVTAVAYWVGVGEDANKQWQRNSTAIKDVVKGAATYFVSPLGALAVGAIAEIALPTTGEVIYYAMVDEENKNLFHAGAQYRVYDEGQGRAGFKKLTDPDFCAGTWFIVLRNDNYTLGLNVDFKVTAIVQTEYYEEKPYTEQKIAARYENKTFKDPVITFTKVPININ